jgi:hypothetical protein
MGPGVVIGELSSASSATFWSQTSASAHADVCHAARFRLMMSRWVWLPHFRASFASGDVVLGLRESGGVGAWFGPGSADSQRASAAVAMESPTAR